MLKVSKAIAMLPVVDMARARSFYEQTLGLPGRPGSRPTARPATRPTATPSRSTSATTPTRADHTALSFEVPDIAAEMKALRSRGVRFEDYDLPGLKTHDGVCVLGGRAGGLVPGSGGQHPLHPPGRLSHQAAEDGAHRSDPPERVDEPPAPGPSSGPPR